MIRGSKQFNWFDQQVEVSLLNRSDICLMKLTVGAIYKCIGSMFADPCLQNGGPLQINYALKSTSSCSRSCNRGPEMRTGERKNLKILDSCGIKNNYLYVLFNLTKSS